MSQLGFSQAAVEYNSTIIGALELSEKKWVLAVQLLELAGVRGVRWTLAVTGWFLLSSV